MINLNFPLIKDPTSAFLGYNLFADSLDELPFDKKLLINTINQYSFCVAEQDAVFKKALQNSDVLLPDGIGIVLAAKFLKGQIIKKISGTDLHIHTLTRLNKVGGKCFYLGASLATLNKIKERLNKDYPSVKSEFYSPPYKSEFDEMESMEMISAVNQFKPDAVFIGMTAPKQEKWVDGFKDKIDAQLICSIGAVFDFYAGTVKRPNQIWINLGLEWFARMIREPKRLYKRYLYYGPIFAYKLLSEKVKS